MTKEEIRNAMRSKRRGLTKEFITDCGIEIAKSFISFIDRPDIVLVFMASFNEPDMTEITEYLYECGIDVAVPVINKTTDEITISRLDDCMPLIKGEYGIPEPKEIIPLTMDDIELALVPGLAFSKKGERIGFGKGYYDRLLKGYNGTKIGICYDFQIFDELPSDENDIKMDLIMTEKGIYNDI